MSCQTRGGGSDLCAVGFSGDDSRSTCRHLNLAAVRAKGSGSVDATLNNQEEPILGGSGSRYPLDACDRLISMPAGQLGQLRDLGPHVGGGLHN